MAADRTESERTSQPGSGLGLDDLIALTDEMAALVRAGVPLETGLAEMATELSGKQRDVANNVAAQLRAGKNLPQVLERSPETFPPIYTAVVEAGLRSGRLSAALEGLANSSRRIAELRRLSRIAMLYPAFIAFLGFGMFVCGIVWFQPRVTQTYESMGLAAPEFNLRLAELGRTAPMWAPWIPLAALVTLVLWWQWSKRATIHSSRWWRFTPTSRLVYYSRLATFADLLALLIEHGTPMNEAVVLAGDACADPRLKDSAHRFAKSIATGATPKLARAEAASGAAAALWGFPPLVRWLLIGGGTQTALVDSLRSMAAAYRRRVERLDDWLRLYVPVGLIVGIGGTAVIINAIALLGPWYQMLKHLGGTLQ